MHSRRISARESRPREIGDPDDALLTNGIEAGSLLQLGLQGVQALGNQVRGGAGPDAALPADDGEGRVVGSRDDSQGLVDHGPEDEVIGLEHE
ncbi:hypothetical protein [Brevibacterium renqingii]|uniref:hypothetical protein n=1 Tax=Brevibacterium renqingii TaxID=2776916 RepID=UPI001FE2C2DB|nr:hypothetical protein [Brevibacterium renqingii]